MVERGASETTSKQPATVLTPSRLAGAVDPPRTQSCCNAARQDDRASPTGDLDDWLKKLWLEEGDGGSGQEFYLFPQIPLDALMFTKPFVWFWVIRSLLEQESYELTAFYYAHHCSLACNKSGKKGFFFFTGDEGYYPACKMEQVHKLISDPVECDIPAERIFELLKTKFEVCSYISNLICCRSAIIGGPSAFCNVCAFVNAVLSGSCA